MHCAAYFIDFPLQQFPLRMYQSVWKSMYMLLCMYIRVFLITPKSDRSPLVWASVPEFAFMGASIKTDPGTTPGLMLFCRLHGISLLFCVRGGSKDKTESGSWGNVVLEVLLIKKLEINPGVYKDLSLHPRLTVVNLRCFSSLHAKLILNQGHHAPYIIFQSWPLH